MRVVGGMPVGPDNLIRTTFTHEPSTLRLSARRPNLHNTPRPSTELGALVRGLFVAPPGWEFWARDFSGIEAVLVGVEAGSARYTRLAKLGVHSWVCAHLMQQRGKLPSSELPDLKWSDEDLHRYFGDIKKRFPVEREASKRCVHAGNYLATAAKLYEEYPQYFPPLPDPKKAGRMLGKSSGAAWFLRFYFELTPEIPRWHERICLQVDKSTIARNAFGYVHRFYRVLNWQYDKSTKEWVWSWGDDAKRLVAFLPQSNAAGIMKESILKMRAEAPEVADTLRLTIHDELLGMAPARAVPECLEKARVVMEAPVKQIPLSPEWGMGDFLTIGTEGKRGPVWGEMKGA